MRDPARRGGLGAGPAGRSGRQLGRWRRMSLQTLLTPDGQVIALLCSTLGLGSSRELKPLSPREWHELSDALRNSELSRPRDLLGRHPEEIGVALGVRPD